jgi:hypothetical protein
MRHEFERKYVLCVPRLYLGVEGEPGIGFVDVYAGVVAAAGQERAIARPPWEDPVSSGNLQIGDGKARIELLECIHATVVATKLTDDIEVVHPSSRTI